MGTAVNVQKHGVRKTWAMIAQRALPSPVIQRPGENVFYGEYLVNAQGEDVVAGVRTPLTIGEMAKDKTIGAAYKELVEVRKTLEKNFGDVQDFEFTIEKKKLYMLQNA